MKTFFTAAAVFLVVSHTGFAQGTTVGILDFKNASGEFYLDKIAENVPILLKTELSADPSLVLVERQNMQQVLDEQDFLMSDLVDNKDAQEKLGKLLDAEFLITGTVTKTGGRIRIDASLIQVKTGRVVSEKASSPSKDYLNQMVGLLGRNLNHHLTGNRTRVDKVKIGGFRTWPFWLSTASLALASAGAQAKYAEELDAYRDATTLKQIDSKYGDVDGLAKVRTTLFVAAGVSATILIYGIVKNAASDREILAGKVDDRSIDWRLAASPDKDGLNLNLQIRF